MCADHNPHIHILIPFQGQFDLINSSPLARFAFKVKSTAQKGVIRVTPVSGVVEPRQTVKVAVTMIHSTIGFGTNAAATNNWLGHRILVQSMEVPKNCGDLDLIWSSTPWRLLKATKLNCVFPPTQRRVTLAANTAVPRRVAQINRQATTVTDGILVGNGAPMTRVTLRRRKKNVTVVSQTKRENNQWAPTVNLNAVNQNDWSIPEDKENTAAAGDENAWGAQNAWAEDVVDGNGIQNNAAGDWAADDNAEGAWATDQNDGAAAPAADDWGNAQNNDKNADWGANDGGGGGQVNDNAYGFDNNADWEANDGGGGGQVNDNAYGFDNNAAAVAAFDGNWAVDNPAIVARGAVAATDTVAATDSGWPPADNNTWPADNNNAVVDANVAWNNGGEAAWNNDNYSATAAAAGEYGGQGMNMTFNHGRVIVAFKGIQDIVLGILVVLFIGLIIGKIF